MGLPEAAQAVIPNAVCFGVTELQEYLTRVETMMEEKGIPRNERGIALMLGKHGSEVPKTHLREKVTVALVASRVIGDETGRITAIDNCVIKEGEFPEPAKSPDDVSYDIGNGHP